MAAGTVVAAIVMAWLFGARSLNAVAVTALVAVIAAVAQVRLADRPSAEHSNPPAGFPGDTRDVTVSITGTQGTIIEANDPLDSGLSSAGNTFSASIPSTVTYEVTLAERGVQSIGPLSVHLRDVFGLVTQELEIGDSTRVIVYPEIYDVTGSTILTAELQRNRQPERQEIDQLREYVPGDPLRDIDWKSSAKRLPDLVVKEFIGRETTGTIKIAVSTDRDTVEAATSAVGSVGLFFARAGLEVGVTLPDGELDPALGETHQDELLLLLAETGPGTIGEHDWAAADVRMVGEDGSVTVDVNGRVTTFEDMRGADDSDQSPSDHEGTETAAVTAT